MKAACAGLAMLALFIGGEAAREVEATNPVEKVIDMMEGMMETGKEEKKKEVVQFAAYKQFCDTTSAQKAQAITEAAEKIELLKAEIEKYMATAEKLGKEIAALDEDISVWTGDKEATQKVRDMEKADYDALHKDYSESVDALTRAIAVLKKQSHDRKQPAAEEEEESFAQVASLTKLELVPSDVKRTIQAFLQTKNEESLPSPPEANAYEFQSGGVVAMLEKLQDKFMAERTQLEKEETEASHNFEMLQQELTTQIAQSKKDREEKAASKAKKLQAKADAEGDLQDTTSTMQEDQKYVDDLIATCEQKGNDFVARQKLRAQELEAVSKAIEIISSDDVKGASEDHLPQFYQEGTSFAQLRSTDKQKELVSKTGAFLQARGKALNSRVLMALALRTASDPFGKVKKMIKDLIVRLMEEANEEAEHKGWCDTELSTNEQTRREKTEAVETLHAEIDMLEASISKLTEDIAELTKAVAELDAAMAEATELRTKEKAKNEQTIADSQVAQTAVAKALTVLREFYEKAGQATAFVQEQPEAPEVFDKPYQGMGGESGGVVGMLEVIEADFARLEAETTTSEAAGVKEYETFMSDSKVDHMGKSKDIEHKTAKKEEEEKALVTKKADVEGNQKELDAALAYFDKLKPTCIGEAESFEDRVARRKEEIESLQTALRVLNGEDIA